MLRYTRNMNLRPLMGTKEGKLQIARLYMDSNLTMEQFASNHGIAKSTLFDYQKALKVLETTGIDTMHEKVGRPPIVDKVGEEHLAKILLTKHKEQGSPNKREFTELVTAEATNTKRRKGIGGEAPPPSWNTINRLRLKLEIVEGKGQIKTHARIVLTLVVSCFTLKKKNK